MCQRHILRRGLVSFGAGEENRTPVCSLEGYCSTIELHPPSLAAPNVGALGGGDKKHLISGGERRIRTSEDVSRQIYSLLHLAALLSPPFFRVLQLPKVFVHMEPMEGIEPPTQGLQNPCSTIEPHRHVFTSPSLKLAAAYLICLLRLN